MSTDWSARTAALDAFEKLLKNLRRINSPDKDLYEAAVYALRRSQDHTAIQTAFKECKVERDALRAVLREILQSEPRRGFYIPVALIERAEKLLEKKP